MRTLVPLVVVLALLTAVPAAGAAAWGVNDTTDTPVGQACPGFTNCSLREALTSTEANPGPDAILVSAGTYPLVNGELTVTQDLTVSRVGAGAATIDGMDASRLFNVTGGPFALRFMTLTRGRVAAGALTGSGGALLGASGTTITIESTTIQNSAAIGDAGAAGGAIFSQGNVTIGTAGGSLTGSVISGNSATSAGGVATGGGVAVAGGNLTVGARTSIRSNTAAGTGGGSASGGGLYDSGGTVTVNQATISGNAATGSPAYGAGVATGGGTLNVLRSTISGNTVTGEGTGQSSGGGGIGVPPTSTATTSVTLSTITGNVAHLDAGATGSAAGGGILGTNAITVANATISGNDAATAGAISGGGPWTIGGSVIAGNTQDSGAQCAGASITSTGYSVLGPFGACTGIPGTGDLTNVADPLLGPLDDNGGLTQTMLPAVGSPALDRIPAADALCVAPTTDQRGVARPQDLGCTAGAVDVKPDPILKPPSTTFPNTLVGRQSANQKLVLRNPAQTAITVDSVTLLGGGASQFALRPAFDTCTGQTVAPGATCEAKVAFAPTSGGAKTAFARVTTTAGVQLFVTLSGTALSQGVAWLGPAAFAFPHTPVGKRSAQQKFTLENRGDQTLNVSSVGLTGANPTQFAIMPATTTCAPGTALAPKETCKVKVRYTPTGAGSHSATLSVSTDDPVTPTVTSALSGTSP
jgi:hypothetical protein